MKNFFIHSLWLALLAFCLTLAATPIIDSAYTASSTDFIIRQDINSISGGRGIYSFSSSTDFSEMGAGGGTALGTSSSASYQGLSSFLVDLSNNSLSFSVDSSSKSFGTITPGILYSATSTLTAATTNPTGFNITVSNSGAANTMSFGANTIVDATRWAPGASCSQTGNASASSTQVQTLEFRVQKATTDSADYCSAWWGSADTSANALFAGFPVTSQQIINRSSSASSGTNAIVLYELEVGSSQTPGTYSGAITYTATANP